MTPLLTAARAAGPMDELRAIVRGFPPLAGGETVAMDPVALRRLWPAIQAVASTHPLMKEWFRRSEADPVRSAADVRGEQLTIALSLMVAGLRDHDTQAIVLGGMALDAASFLWLSDPMREANGMPMPDHVLGRDVLPVSPAWFTFENDYDGGELGWDALSGVLMGNVTAIGSTPGDARPGLATVWIGRRGAGITYQLGGHRFGDRVTVPAGHENRAHPINPLAMCSFLNSPYIPKSDLPMTRQMRRLLGRYDAEERALATFVDLRPSIEEHVTDDDEHGSGRTYRSRWIVRGHHRAQWYPSQQAHRVIWVSPYVKGSPDAPLLERPYRVVR